MYVSSKKKLHIYTFTYRKHKESRYTMVVWEAFKTNKLRELAKIPPLPKLGRISEN